MKKISISLLTIIVSITITYGQTIDKIKLDNKQSILNDRAFFNFPTDAKNQMRGTDIMSADPNKNKETRIVLDIDTMRLVFFAQELFSISDNNFFNEVSKEKDKKGFQRKILTDKDQLLSILSTPTIFDSTQNAILMNSLLVKTQDNTIFRIDAYINPNAYKLKNDFIKLTEQVFQTLSKGTRVNNRKAREESYEIIGTKKHFKFTLPENYCITIDQKYDFQVFKFHKYSNYTDTNWVSLIMYAGNHPSYAFRQYGFDKNDAASVKGEFLDNDVEWLTFHSGSKGLFLKEQQIPSNNIEDGLIIHIVSNSAVSVEELTRIVEGIKLTKK
jgi:hypothetical protein